MKGKKGSVKIIKGSKNIRPTPTLPVNHAPVGLDTRSPTVAPVAVARPEDFVRTSHTAGWVLDLGLEGPPSLAKEKYKEVAQNGTLLDNVLLIMQDRRRAIVTFEEELDEIERSLPDATILVSRTEKAATANQELVTMLQDVVERLAAEALDDTLSSSFIPESISRDNLGYASLEVASEISERMYHEAKGRLSRLQRRQVILKSNIAIARHSLANLELVHETLADDESTKAVMLIPSTLTVENRSGRPEELEFIDCCIREEESCRLAMAQIRNDREWEADEFQSLEKTLNLDLEHVLKVQSAFSETKAFFAKQSAWVAQMHSRERPPYVNLEKDALETWNETLTLAHTKIPEMLGSVDHQVDAIKVELGAVKDMQETRSKALSRLHRATLVIEKVIESKALHAIRLRRVFFKVPEDIWRYLFSWCVTGEKQEMVKAWRSGRPLTPRIPTTLSSICRFWRQITTHTPELWRSLVLPWIVAVPVCMDWGDDEFDDVVRSIDLYHRHLELSKGEKLDIFVWWSADLSYLASISSLKATEAIYLDASSTGISIPPSRVLHYKTTNPMTNHLILSRTDELYLYRIIPSSLPNNKTIKVLDLSGPFQGPIELVWETIKKLPSLERFTIRDKLQRTENVRTRMQHTALRHLSILTEHLLFLFNENISFPNLAKLTLLDFNVLIGDLPIKSPCPFPALQQLEFTDGPVQLEIPAAVCQNAYQLCKTFLNLTTLELKGTSIDFGLGVIFNSLEDPILLQTLRVTDSTTTGGEISQGLLSYRERATQTAWSAVRRMRIELVDCPEFDLSTHELIREFL